MKPGTIVRVADGREGTVVYHFLDGYGVKWGRHTLGEGWENDAEFKHEALLRKPYEGAKIECVGSDYEVIGDDE